MAINLELRNVTGAFLARRLHSAAIAFCLALLMPTNGLWAQRSEAQARPDAKRSRPPNILLIVPDDQPLGTMDAMPRTSAWFVERATEFPNAYVTTPLCCPSRSSILTGRYAHNHRVRRNQDANSLDTRSMVQRMLQDMGYRTGAFGKFLNSWDVEREPPFFDDWAVIPKASAAYRNGIWNVDGVLEQVTEYGTRFVGDRTERFIRRNEKRDSQPWFAYVAPPAPHAPFTPESKYRSAYVPSWSGEVSNRESDPFVDTWMKTDKPGYVQRSDKDLATGQRIRRRQYRTLMTLDDVVADLQHTLRETKELADTMVIYYSDNGFLWSQHGVVGKNVPYLESIRVPAFVKWPSSVAPYPIDDRMVANIDIAPTILDAAGVEPDPGFVMDGRSLLDDWARERLLIEAWSNEEVTTWAGLISRDHSYIEYYGADDRTETFSEYYDIVQDPYELNNLLGDPDPLNDPPEVDALSAELDEARICYGSDDCP